MAHVEHYRQIAETLARHGFGFAIGVAGLQNWVPLHRGLIGHESREVPYSNPEHLRLALEQLGPTYIKLGQILSTRPDLLPAPYRSELAKLQDSAPPVPGSVIADLIELELGDAPLQVFASFDLEPLASASLGQAHAATLHDGTDVVVKVRRPHIVEQVEQDLEVLRNLAIRAGRRWEAAADYDLAGIAEEFADTLRAELDYVHEGRNAERFAANFAASHTIYIPQIYWETTTSRVLTIERISGIKVNDLAALDAAGIERRILADNAAQAAAKMIFEDGFFHADPHPGNLFVQSDGRIGLIDFGMVGEVDEALREALSMLLIALAGRDPRRVALAVIELTSSRTTVNVSALATDLAPILERYAGRALAEVPAGALIQDVLAVVSQHHLRQPRGLALLSKMLVMAEGLGTELDPQFQLSQVIGPYARRLVAGRYSPEGIVRQLRRAGVDVLDVLAELPVQLRRMRDMLDAGGPEVHLRTAELEPFIDRLEATGRQLQAALLTAAVIRTVGDIVSTDPRRRRSRTFSVVAAALGATGVVGASRALTLRPRRNRRK